MAVTLLAWGMIPPGYQHAHLGGDDDSHRHDEQAKITNHDSQLRHSHHPSSGHHHFSDKDSHHTHGHQNEMIQGETTVCIDETLHNHFSFFGFDFSQPLSEVPVDDENDEDNFPTIIVYLVKEYYTPCPSTDIIQLDSLQYSEDSIQNPEPIPRSEAAISSIPLCDSARLERTGVLRI